MTDQLNVQELYQKISVDHNLHVIDVRDQDVFARGHIPGALNNPNLRLQAAPNFVPDNHPVVLYGDDESGGEAIEKSAQLLRELGLQVHILTGGIEAWTAAGLPIETEQQ